jgi:hypothetical protein
LVMYEATYIITAGWMVCKTLAGLPFSVAPQIIVFQTAAGWKEE